MGSVAVLLFLWTWDNNHSINTFCAAINSSCDSITSLTRFISLLSETDFNAGDHLPHFLSMTNRRAPIAAMGKTSFLPLWRLPLHSYQWFLAEKSWCIAERSKGLSLLDSMPSKDREQRRRGERLTSLPHLWRHLVPHRYPEFESCRSRKSLCSRRKNPSSTALPFVPMMLLFSSWEIVE